MNSKKLILSGILPIFILGAIIHFTYDWCSITLLGLISPINSSVWEHMKMGVSSTIIWWGITYLLFLNCIIKSDKYINKKRHL